MADGSTCRQAPLQGYLGLPVRGTGAAWISLMGLTVWLGRLGLSRHGVPRYFWGLTFCTFKLSHLRTARSALQRHVAAVGAHGSSSAGGSAEFAVGGAVFVEAFQYDFQLFVALLGAS